MPAIQATINSTDTSAIEVAVDLSASVGPLSAAGDLIVHRNVLKGAKVRAGGSIRVNGTIELASITCGGELIVDAGEIKGGSISAYGGVSCKSLGDPRGTPTELHIGFDEQFMQYALLRIPEIEKAVNKSNQFRALLEPMLKEQKDLSAEQKEQISDLLCRAGEARKRAVIAVRQLLNQIVDTETCAKPELLVHETIFAGVTVFFPGARVVLDTAITGPVKIVATIGSRSTTVSLIKLDTQKFQAMQLVAQVDRIEELRNRLKLLEQS